ncbi:MAG TPA: hypothetical protein PKZ36_02175 [Candidatus Paceibacterota bacterium]|nr:hypothetical protein [Candidatus Paceibacterota bacterium]HPT18190.1 hypothetical protein [Candidatus Paceibacterota bacterium]
MINNFKKNLFVLILVSFIVFSPVLLFAQGGTGSLGDSGGTGSLSGDTTSGQLKNPINQSSINGLIKTILEGVLKIGIPIVALAIIYCGFLFVSARGNPEALKKAKDALIYTLIGAAILLGSWAIAQLISDTVLKL